MELLLWLWLWDRRFLFFGLIPHPRSVYLIAYIWLLPMLLNIAMIALNASLPSIDQEDNFCTTRDRLEYLDSLRWVYFIAIIVQSATLFLQLIYSNYLACAESNLHKIKLQKIKRPPVAPEVLRQQQERIKQLYLQQQTQLAVTHQNNLLLQSEQLRDAPIDHNQINFQTEEPLRHQQLKKRLKELNLQMKGYIMEEYQDVFQIALATAQAAANKKNDENNRHVQDTRLYWHRNNTVVSIPGALVFVCSLFMWIWSWIYITQYFGGHCSTTNRSSLYYSMIHAWILLIAGSFVIFKVISLLVLKIIALLGFGLCPLKYLKFEKGIVQCKRKIFKADPYLELKLKADLDKYE